jgi:hypothetical protein
MGPLALRVSDSQLRQGILVPPRWGVQPDRPWGLGRPLLALRCQEPSGESLAWQFLSVPTMSTLLGCRFLVEGAVVILLDYLGRFRCWVWLLGGCGEVGQCPLSCGFLSYAMCLWVWCLFFYWGTCALFLLLNIMIHNSLVCLRKKLIPNQKP